MRCRVRPPFDSISNGIYVHVTASSSWFRHPSFPMMGNLRELRSPSFVLGFGEGARFCASCKEQFMAEESHCRTSVKQVHTLAEREREERVIHPPSVTQASSQKARPQHSCRVWLGIHGIFFLPLTTNYKYQIKFNYKTTSTTPCKSTTPV